MSAPSGFCSVTSQYPLPLSVERRYQPRPKAVGRMPKLCGPDLDDLTLGAWRRHRQAVLLQPGNVEFYDLADQPQHLRPGFAYRYTPWKVRHVGSPTRRPAL